MFTRIVGHLTKNPSCIEKIDLEDFKSVWSKFTLRKRHTHWRSKKKAENKELFLEEKTRKQRNLYKDKKVEESSRKESFTKNKMPRTKRFF